ncbi:MAG: c-type cytochrome [Woeseiaceae bacterium]
MSHRFVLMIGPLLLAACAYDSGQSTDGLVNGGQKDIENLAMNGEAAYNEYCAGCHETGMMGAPVAGDAAEWGTRSRLWDAVLLDHAITGYLEMPARGGRMDLPDDVVKSAAEYMLRVTFPDMPHDCNPPLCSDADQ